MVGCHETVFQAASHTDVTLVGFPQSRVRPRPGRLATWSTGKAGANSRISGALTPPRAQNSTDWWYQEATTRIYNEDDWCLSWGETKRGAASSSGVTWWWKGGAEGTHSISQTQNWNSESSGFALLTPEAGDRAATDAPPWGGPCICLRSWCVPLVTDLFCCSYVISNPGRHLVP